jgi:hypothetical protein
VPAPSAPPRGRVLAERSKGAHARGRPSARSRLHGQRDWRAAASIAPSALARRALRSSSRRLHVRLTRQRSAARRSRRRAARVWFV